MINDDKEMINDDKEMIKIPKIEATGTHCIILRMRGGEIQYPKANPSV